MDKLIKIKMTNTESIETKVNTGEVAKRKKGVTLGKYLLLSFLAGCAGMQRSCSSCMAEEFAADWIVAEYNYMGTPTHCWKLENTSIANESQSDGIYWLDRGTHNLVHISGWYNRVQVENNMWQEAANSLGISLDRCTDGKYRSE